MAPIILQRGAHRRLTAGLWTLLPRGALSQLSLAGQATFPPGAFVNTAALDRTNQRNGSVLKSCSATIRSADPHRIGC